MVEKRNSKVSSFALSRADHLWLSSLELEIFFRGKMDIRSLHSCDLCGVWLVFQAVVVHNWRTSHHHKQLQKIQHLLIRDLWVGHTWRCEESFVVTTCHRHLSMWYHWNEPSHFIDNMCYILLWFWPLDFNFLVTGSILEGNNCLG